MDCDVVVVGGGINGVGVAQACAAAGYSVCVLERSGLASGTSSKSSKLIHGGLRYLESLQFRLVYESLHERAVLLRIAPELVRLQRFAIPVYEQTRRSPQLIRTGLALYYLLSRLDRNARFGSIPRRQWSQLEGLRTDGLRAVLSYQDAVTDDTALTQAVMQSAGQLGAELLCPAEFTGAELHADGVCVHYRQQTHERSVTARVLINAAGPWVNQVAERVRPQPPAPAVELVQGTHIELPGAAGELFYYLESPRDGRAVFLMPRGQRVLVGTTETRYRADPDAVRPLAAEISYLLGVAGHYFPSMAAFDAGSVLAAWAGLRVLPRGSGHAFHRSRETLLPQDDPRRPRYVGIYGGKLTSYRATAARVLKQLRATLPGRRRRARTDRLTLQPGSP